MEFEWKRLRAVLDAYGEAARDMYRAELEKRKKNASSALSSTAENITLRTASGFEVGLILQDYWKYVEYGRKPGKWPPRSVIERWISVKPVTPRAEGGKIPTVPQLAYLIQRKIGTEGVTPVPVLEDTRTATWEKFADDITAAMELDIAEALASL